MTERLYYRDSFLYDFEAKISNVIDTPRPAIILDRTAFYPTSGGQISDTGTLFNEEATHKVTEVAEMEDGRIIHYLEAPTELKPGALVHGLIDGQRRRDHMQQHSGQHVLSAAFIRLFNFPTVSFHMADDYCSIDLETVSLTEERLESAERLANATILENLPVDIRFVTRKEAEKLGLRKIPPTERDEMRLIDVRGFDLTACGGTHVRQTGQIGCILLRKSERVRQGFRVEFVAGQRVVSTARRDFSTLTEAASLFSSHIYDVPHQARKSLDEMKSLRKQREKVLDELAAAEAAVALAEVDENDGLRLVVRSFSDREMSFLKVFAQKLTRLAPNAVAILGTTSPPPALVFAQSAGQSGDMGALMKETLGKFGGRGGGSKDMAQGGVPDASDIAPALAYAKVALNSKIGPTTGTGNSS
ncbi:MAG TPA: alanyl-tRNA editing protein [Candidatus Sulfotelmatobacter sp.]|nr:alanyl-tRNA editing protein [Candidatus Sulfotelmatobacter sp.]